MEQVKTVILAFKNGLELILSNLAYALRCNSNLISLGQLCKTGISYHDYHKYMILKQRRSIIRLAINRKNLFALNTCTLLGRAMLYKRRGRPTYLLNKNPQIRLWQQRLGHISNTRVLKTSKLIDKINIMVEEDREKEQPFSSDFEIKNENKSSESSSISNTHPTTTPLNRVTNISINSIHSVEQLCDSFIESKYIKIVKYEKMTPTIRKLKEIHTDL